MALSCLKTRYYGKYGGAENIFLNIYYVNRFFLKNVCAEFVAKAWNALSSS